MILDSSIMEYHTSFMTKYKSDFSNILRADNRLTGLHFMEYDKMYPVSIPKGVDLASVNDEVLLCSLMREKHFRFPPSGISTSERHIHGIHASMYNRPPLSTLTTKDRAADFPSWQIEPEDSGAARYFDIRYSEPVVEFTKCIDDKQIKLRSMIQILDMFAYYKLHEGVRV